MSSVLHSPSIYTNRLNNQFDRKEELTNEAKEETPEERPGLPSWQSLSVLGGCGLLVWGTLRGSWSGLALAALGGWLVYRGLSRSEEQDTPHEIPEANEPATDLLEQQTTPLSVRAAPQPTLVEEALVTSAADVEMCTVVAITLDQVEELTPEEHELARTTAYYFALERGGGNLPGYEYYRAMEDFCRAAAQILASRVRV